MVLNVCGPGGGFHVHGVGIGAVEGFSHGGAVLWGGLGVWHDKVMIP